MWSAALYKQAAGVWASGLKNPPQRPYEEIEEGQLWLFV